MPAASCPVRYGRTRRTTHFEHGEEQAVCTGDERSEHPAPARISGFDVTSRQDRLILRSVVDYWWSQSGSFSAQSTVVRPRNETCAHCAAPLATDAHSPDIRLLA
ncbi:hypothetical protein [Streptomyces gilvosporeus]|uniref:Uncharacterized protein n=1 Tax=Streptomyces gilvosporeus TaxID=553510 RepID=A0A1V0TKH7_9ACTN|nr:hypothetical protein [Streptomyces gilvosporeus]ARF53429.1 hypothetical protein B1H19_03950 [Streptomyces gilvosporeus]